MLQYLYMWRAFAKSAIVFTLGVFVSFGISTRPISVDRPSEALTQVQKATPYLNLQAATLLPTVTTSNILSEESINARFVGLLSHVRWLIDNQKSSHGGGGGGSNGVSRALFDKQIEKLSDNTSDSITGLRTDLEEEINNQVATGTWQGSPITDAYVSNVLTIGAGSTLANNLITPNNLLSTGQVDENCLTYEATGSTFEWQVCGTGGGLLATDIDTSAELAAILSDETGTGAAVFAGSPTLSGTLTAAAANFNGKVGIGSTSPSASLTVQNAGSGNSFIVEDQANDTTPFVIDTNGTVGIGTLTPNARTSLNVEKISTITSAYAESAIFHLKANPGADSTADYSAIDSYVDTQGNNNIASISGTYSALYHNGNGTVTSGYGVWADVANYGSGTISTLSNLYASTENVGVVTNYKGININSLTNSGTITNTYGLYLGDLSTGTQTNQAYSVYASDANTRNYFAGNVGIGSTSPSASLTVTNTGAAPSFVVEDQAGDSTPFIIDANGRVGVGKIFSNYKFTVDSTSADFAHYGSGVYVEGDPTIANSRYGGVDAFVSSKAGNNTNMRYLFGVGSGVGHYGNGSLQELQGNYSYVEGGGSGTVANAVAYDAYAYNSSNTSTFSSLKYFSAENLVNTGTITDTYGLYIGDLTAGTQTNQAYSIYAADANTRNYFAGNVGIGTSTPTAMLHVAKAVVGAPVSAWFENTDNTNTSSNAALGLAVGGASAGNPFFDFAVSGATDWSVGIKNNDSDKLYFSPNWALGGTPTLVMTTGGSVGIGTTTPAQKLQVLGDIRVGTAGSNGCIENYGGGVIGGTCSSDGALKTDVVALAESKRNFLDGLTALTPVTYHWNDTAADLYTKDKNMDNIGFIAQDVEAQFPELVSINKDGYRQVNFTALPFYIIEALKELWTKVQGHDEKIIQLEAENKNLKARLETVEDKLNITPPPAPTPAVPVEESNPVPVPLPSESDTPAPEAILPLVPVSGVPSVTDPIPDPPSPESTFTLVPGESF